MASPPSSPSSSSRRVRTTRCSARRTISSSRSSPAWRRTSTSPSRWSASPRCARTDGLAKSSRNVYLSQDGAPAGARHLPQPHHGGRAHPRRHQPADRHPLRRAHADGAGLQGRLRHRPQRRDAGHPAAPRRAPAPHRRRLAGQDAAHRQHSGVNAAPYRVIPDTGTAPRTLTFTAAPVPPGRGASSPACPRPSRTSAGRAASPPPRDSASPGRRASAPAARG